MQTNFLAPIKRPALLAVLSLAAPLHALTLHQAQDLLFQDNPDLAVMRLEVERAQDQVQEARAAWLPSVDAFGNYNYTTETSRLKLTLPVPPPNGTSIDKTLGDHDRVELGIDASYPLFTGFARGYNVEAKRAGVSAREAQWQGARNQMSLRLAALYYTWQLSALQVAYQEKVLGHSREYQKQLEDFVRAGTAVRSRALAAEAKAKAAEVDLLAAQNTRDSLAFEVVDFLGRRDSTSLNGPLELAQDTSVLPNPDWETATPEASRPETEALNKSAEQARSGSQALLGQRYPQLYGMAGFRYANPGLNMAENAYMSYGIFGLQLKWNLFDGSKNRAQRKQMEIQIREFEQQKLKLSGEWWKAMQTARSQYARWDAQFLAARASRDAADAAAGDLKRQFEVGVATGVDWLEARNNQARAELLMEQARTMQRLSLLQWRYAAGKELRF